MSEQTSYVDMFLEEYIDISNELEKACMDFEKNPSSHNCDAVFRLVHTIKGSSQTVGLMELGDFVHHLEDALVKIKSGTLEPSGDFIKALFSCLATTEAWIELIRKKSQQKPQAQIDAGLALLAKAQNNVPTQNKGKPAENAIAHAHAHGTTQAPSNTPQSDKKKDADESVRVSIKKIDRLLQLVGEVSSQVSIIWHQNEQGIKDAKKGRQAIYLANKIARELREQTLSLRMQPIEPLFQKMERVARDVARQLGKEVNVVLSGAEVELDKTVIDYIKDPLLHIVRNAIDHGIEPAEDRKQANKAPQGTIEIKAENHANGVNIIIVDDGRGLDTERIHNKAVEKGIVSRDQKVSEEFLFQLIMMPGFSTAAKVTDISGRGVGMDVVKSAINECSGDIQISSKKGSGSTFMVFIPSTVSIMDAMIVDVLGLLYAVPVQDIAEIIDMIDFKVSTCTDEGQVLLLRNEIVPLKSLAEFLPAQRLASNDPNTPSSIPERYQKPGLVVRRKHAVCAFSVNKVIGIQSIVIRPLDGEFRRMKCFAGCTILQDGEPGYILNLGHLAQAYFDTFETTNIAGVSAS